MAKKIPDSTLWLYYFKFYVLLFHRRHDIHLYTRTDTHTHTHTHTQRIYVRIYLFLTLHFFRKFESTGQKLENTVRQPPRS